MRLLAACEGTTFLSRVVGIGVALAILVFWIGMVWLFAWSEREPAERRALFIILVLSGCVSALILLSLHEGLETLLLFALIATSAFGAGASLLLRVSIPRGVGTAVIGGIAVPVAVLIIILVYTYLGGICLGEELG